MNMEQRARRLAAIQKLEGLLAYARTHGDNSGAERIRAERVKLIEEL